MPFNDSFLRACRGERVYPTPVWLMRQAGRYMAEYMAVRRKVDFVTLCKTPELAAEVTLQPIDRLDVDAAILFSDILVVAEPLGFRIAFDPGPVIDRPVRSAADVERMRRGDPEQEVPFVFETLRILRRELADRVPVIGFAAAPFTLAVYLVEGGGSKNFDQIKRLLYADPAAVHRLMERVAETTAAYCAAQLRAGAQAIQLFDTWAGLLSPSDYGEFALRYARQVFDLLPPDDAPRIYFALNSAHLLEKVRGCGADVVGVDWRLSLDEASRRLGGRFPLQGNLDPCVLFAPEPVIDGAAARIVAEARSIPAHVFNLGHGVLPGTPVEHVQALVAAVRRHSRDEAGGTVGS